MGKNSYTELDKLFQSKLKDGNVENGTWNNPTDDAFMAAMNQVKPEEKSKKKAAWWPLSFLLLIPLLLIGIKYTDEVNDLRSELDEIQQQINEAQASIIKEKNDDAVQFQSNEKIVLQSSTSQDVIQNKSDKATRKAGLNTSPSSKSTRIDLNKSSSERNFTPTLIPPPTSVNDSRLNRSLSAGVTRGSDFKTPNTVNTGKGLLVEANKERLEKILGFERLDGNFNLITDARPKAKLEGLALATLNPEEKSGFGMNLSAFAFFDLNLNTIRMSGAEQNGFSLTGYDDAQLGYELGIGISQNLSKRWDIAYTASYRHFTNRSLYQSEFMYEEEDLVTNVDGELVYQLFIETQTPTGAYITNQDLVFTEEMDDHTMMDANADIELFFNFVSLGVKPRYSLFQKNGLEVFAEAGLNMNYLVHYCQSVAVALSHNNKPMMNDSGDNYSMDDLNRVSFTSSLGLGLEYNLGKHIFSSIKFGTSRSLNSITASNNNSNDTRTYLDNLGISLSAGYRF